MKSEDEYLEQAGRLLLPSPRIRATTEQRIMWALRAAYKDGVIDTRNKMQKDFKDLMGIEK